MTSFEDRQDMEVIEIKCGHKSRTLFDKFHVLIRCGREVRPGPSLPLHEKIRGHERTQREGRPLQARKRALTRYLMLSLKLWHSSLLCCDKTNTSCPSPPACGILLWHPELTNTSHVFIYRNNTLICVFFYSYLLNSFSIEEDIITPPLFQKIVLVKSWKKKY